jgi:hypothetical protein
MARAHLEGRNGIMSSARCQTPFARGARCGSSSIARPEPNASNDRSRSRREQKLRRKPRRSNIGMMSCASNWRASRSGNHTSDATGGPPSSRRQIPPIRTSSICKRRQRVVHVGGHSRPLAAVRKLPHLPRDRTAGGRRARQRGSFKAPPTDVPNMQGSEADLPSAGHHQLKDAPASTFDCA